MTRDQAIAIIQRGLGYRTDQFDEIVSALQQAQRLLEKGRTLPRFLLEEDQTVDLVAGTNTQTFPTGFIREIQEERFHFVSSSGQWTYLEKMTIEEGQVRFGTTAAGRPQAYAVRKGQFRFFPDQDAAYTLYWSYYKQGVSLATNATNSEWLDSDSGAPEVLIGRAGMIMAEDLKNPSAFKKFQSMYGEAWSGVIADDILLSEEADAVVLGGRL